MNNHNIKLHKYQAQLIKKLVSARGFRFNELLLEGLESEHVNYHLKKLISLGFVKKGSEKYQLTDSGKDYSNMMDDEVEVVEKQPKSAVLIRGVRKNDKGEVEHLLSKRLRQPYLGKVGRLTGKLRFGETLEEGVKRELYEETGMTANSLELDQIYRKIRWREDGTIVQDVIFYIYLVKDFEGKMIEKTDFQENFWLTTEQAKKEDLYDDMELIESVNVRKLEVIQNTGVAKGF